MTLNEYQEAAAETAIYPEAGSSSNIALAYCALGLGEAGEIQNLIKKILRGDIKYIDSEFRSKLINELGDLQWYVAQLATELNYTLHEVACINLSKLQDRQARGVLKGSGGER